MCPKLIELLSWNGPTVHVCCFLLARASTKTFVSWVQKTAKNPRYPKNSLEGSLVSRGITVLRSTLLATSRCFKKTVATLHVMKEMFRCPHIFTYLLPSA